MIKKYRKKPVVKVLQWDGSNLIEVIAFLKEVSIRTIKSEINSSEIAQKNWMKLQQSSCNEGIVIPTLEGNIFASVGDFIIKGSSGKFFSLHKRIFEEIYESIK